MVHGNAVTNTDGVKFERHAALAANSRLYRLGNGSQMNMAGHDLVETVDHTDKRFGEVITTYADSPKQSTMWRPLDAFFNTITTQCLQNCLLMLK
jgi:hypothetical protein